MNSQRFSKMLLAAVLALLIGSPLASAQVLTVYAARASMSGYLQTFTGQFQTLTPWRLNTAQFINLALGQPIETKLPPGVTLAIAADQNAMTSSTSSAQTEAPKEVIVVNTNPGDGYPYGLLSKIIVSDSNSVCNAQNTYRKFKRLGFGGGNVRSTGNITGGRVQMVGFLLQKETRTGGVTPITSLSMVGSIDLLVNGADVETFYVTTGAVTASGAPIGTLSN